MLWWVTTPKTGLFTPFPLAVFLQQCWFCDYLSSSFWLFCAKCTPISWTLMGSSDENNCWITDAFKKTDKLPFFLNYAFMIWFYRPIFGLCYVWWNQVVVYLCSIHICTNFCAFVQKNPFAHINWYRIYAEESYAQNLIH